MRKICIDISTACPAKCRYCLHQYRGLVKPRFMTTAAFTTIFDIIKREGFNYVYPYLSGEPTIHPAFWLIVKTLSAGGITSNTATKMPVGLDADEMEACFKAAVAPLHFDITIDACTQKTQDRISAGTLNVETVWENLKKIAVLIPKYRHKVRASVITVHNRCNEAEVTSIKRRCANLGLKWQMKPMGFYMGYAMNAEDLRNIESLTPRYGSPRYTIAGGRIRSRLRECPFMKPVIGPEGHVTLCCHDMLYAQSRWNIFETKSLRFILDSKEYRDMEREARFMRLPICKGCN